MIERELKNDKQELGKILLEVAAQLGQPVALNLLAQYIAPLTVCSEAVLASLVGAAVGYLLERPGKKGRSVLQVMRITLMGMTSLIIGGLHAKSQSLPPMPAGIEQQRVILNIEADVIVVAIVLLLILHSLPQDDT